MKKILVFLAIIIGVMCINKKEEVIIPKASIRFRVIANSNALEDQTIKNNLTKKLSEYINNLIGKSENIYQAKNQLIKNYDNIDNYIGSYLKENNNDYNYTISLGDNYFPSKTYQGITYPEGNYESLVVKLGSGSGLNWWCVVYPPLCTINENTDDVEYTTIAEYLFNKLNS